MLNILGSILPPPQIVSPAEIYQQGLQLRSLGQTNRQQAQQIRQADMSAPYEEQRLQQEQQLRGQQIQGFQPTLDATKLKNEDMANELAETYIAQKAKEIKALPLEKRAEAAKGLTDWLAKRQQMYPDYAHIYEPSHFSNSKWDDAELSYLENINVSPDQKYVTDNKPVTQTDDQREYAAAQGQGYKGSLLDWITTQKKSGASNTTINTGVPLAKEVAKNFADEVSTLNTEAETAAASIPAIRNSIKLVDQGIIAGTGADVRLTMAKALATATGTPDEEVNNTDQFVANTAQLVAQNIKNFGSGTGLSDADREYAQKMAGGSTKMTPQAIKRILQINEKVQRGKIDRYNKRRSKLLKQNPELGGYYDEIKVEEPGTTLSANDQEALNWANANPKDPRAAAIKKKLGM